jgi:hypothetical protein
MPTGPKGQKRKVDVIGNAVLIARIATGEVDDDVPDDGKDPAAKALGKKGGAARAKSMTPERRAEIARRPLLSAGRNSFEHAQKFLVLCRRYGRLRKVDV